MSLAVKLTLNLSSFLTPRISGQLKADATDEARARKRKRVLYHTVDLLSVVFGRNIHILFPRYLIAMISSVLFHDSILLSFHVVMLPLPISSSSPPPPSSHTPRTDGGEREKATTHALHFPKLMLRRRLSSAVISIPSGVQMKGKRKGESEPAPSLLLPPHETITSDEQVRKELQKLLLLCRTVFYNFILTACTGKFLVSFFFISAWGTECGHS